MPGQPTGLKAKPASRSLTIGWFPPRDTNIMVRGYRIGWGPGVPDLHTKTIEGAQRVFTISDLRKWLLRRRSPSAHFLLSTYLSGHLSPIIVMLSSVPNSAI